MVLLISVFLTLVAGFLIRYALSATANDSKKRRRGDCNNENSDAGAPYPPSPPNAHWLFGHALQLPSTPTPAADLTFLEWSLRYGKVFSFWVPLTPRIIVVGDPEFARHILESKNYPKSPSYRFFFPMLGHQSLVVANESDWRAKRRAFTPGFTPDALRSVVVNVVVDKCDRLIAQCWETMRHDGEVTMLDRTSSFSADVIAQVAFGEDWGEGSPGYANSPFATFHTLADECFNTYQNPLRLFHPLARWRAKKLQKKLDQCMLAVLCRRLEKMRIAEAALSTAPQQQRDRCDILSLAIRAFQLDERREENQMEKGAANKIGKPFLPASLEQLDVDSVISHLKTFYFAGHNTTAILIAWTTWLLAQHPESCQKVREEALSEFGQWAISQQSFSSSGSQSKKGEQANNLVDPPTYDDLKSYIYLEAVLKETLRLYPSIFTIRYCDNPSEEFGGYRIGQCNLCVNAYVLHHHPDLWDEPEVFCPERFLDSESEQSVEHKYMPFSRSPRDCIGRYFGLLEAKIAVAALVLSFDIVAVDPNEKIQQRMFSQPNDGCRVHLSKRMC